MIVALLAVALGLAGSPGPEEIEAHDEARIRMEIRGMGALMGWGGASMVGGAVGWALAEDPAWQGVHQMNLAWGAVDVAIAGLGLAGALGEEPAELDRAETWRRDAALQRVLWLNAGLDVAYVAGGAWMVERGLRTDDPRLVGWGRSVMVQGAFLLVFDVALAVIHGRRVRRLFR